MSILYPVSYLDKLLRCGAALQMNCIAALAVAVLSCRLTVFFVEVLHFAIVVQLCGPPPPPFPTYFRPVTDVTFSHLFMTAGLFCNCSSMVELEVVLHHDPMFTILNVIFLSPAG